jgi:hypothetical protein
MAKITYGICDNLLTCVYRAWDWRKPVVMAPAMNTFMWANAPTGEQINALTKKVSVLSPVEKTLACGDTGVGAMASTDNITRTVRRECTWLFPLIRCSGIPINHHPGAFGFHRKKNHHTGVDLYCEDEEIVYAVESGTVVNIDVFTGPKLGHTWWEETHGVMIEGMSGVVNYGEITPKKDLTVGDKIHRGELIGAVKRVLFPNKLRLDIPGHSTSMLHLELYTHDTREFADWHEAAKNPTLLDPTPFLMTAEDRNCGTLTWDNSQGVEVG